MVVVGRKGICHGSDHIETHWEIMEKEMHVEFIHCGTASVYTNKQAHFSLQRTSSPWHISLNCKQKTLWSSHCLHRVNLWRLALIVIGEEVENPWSPPVIKEASSCSVKSFEVIVSVSALSLTPMCRNASLEVVILCKSSRQLIMNEDKVVKQTRLHSLLFVLSMSFTIGLT